MSKCKNNYFFNCKTFKFLFNKIISLVAIFIDLSIQNKFFNYRETLKFFNI